MSKRTDQCSTVAKQGVSLEYMTEKSFTGTIHILLLYVIIKGLEELGIIMLHVFYCKLYYYR